MTWSPSSDRSTAPAGCTAYRCCGWVRMTPCSMWDVAGTEHGSVRLVRHDATRLAALRAELPECPLSEVAR